MRIIEGVQHNQSQQKRTETERGRHHFAKIWADSDKSHLSMYGK